MRPRNLSGEGTVSDAGMWSTSSVLIRGSCRYSWMSLVYSSSTFWGAGAAVVAVVLPFLLWANPGHTASASATINASGVFITYPPVIHLSPSGVNFGAPYAGRRRKEGADLVFGVNRRRDAGGSPSGLRGRGRTRL